MESVASEPLSELELLRLVLDSTGTMMLVVNSQGHVIRANAAVEQAMGMTQEELAVPIWELAGQANERALLRAPFSSGELQGLPPSLLFHLATATSPAPVVDWTVKRIPSLNGQGPWVVFSGIDLSQRITTERHLRESESLQRLILDRLPAVVWTTDANLRFTSSAGGGLKALGLGDEQVALLGTSLYSYFHTTDSSHPMIAPHLRALEGESSTSETSWNDRVFTVRVDPLRDRNKAIIGCIGLALDVTERAEAHRKLERLETRFGRLIESNLIGVHFWDSTGRVYEANNAFLQLVGYSSEELAAGRITWNELTPPEQRARDDLALAEIESTGRCAPYEKEYLAKDGTRVPVLVAGASLREGDRGAFNGVAFAVDLREQVRLRAARDQLLLQEQQARLETEVANARLVLLVQGSKRLAGVLSIDDVLRILAELVIPGLADWSYVIHRGEKGGPELIAAAHGNERGRKLISKLEGCIPEPEAPEGAARVFRTGKPVLYEEITYEQLSPSAPHWPVLGTRDPGHLHTLRELGLKSLLCVPISGRSGVDAVLMLASATDPHRYGRDDMVLAQELAGRAAAALENARLFAEARDSIKARDEFLTVAAHDLRTPITTLLLRVQSLGRNLEAERFNADAAFRSLRAAEAQARRLATLVDGLLDVTRLGSDRLLPQQEEIDLAKLVRDVVGQMEPSLTRARCVVTLTAPEQVKGRWDRVRMEQVVTNLLSNAMKFGAGTPIEMTVRALDGAVELSVCDHGIGISKEDQARIFRRFERAVSSRHFGGMGLGLYISDQIVRLHGGSLSVKSEPGKGACFTVHLPRTNALP